MIAGRPTNLWLGLATTVVGLLSAIALVGGVDPRTVAQLAAAVTAVLGAGIALVAYQPPTLNPGDPFHTTTPPGQPSATSVVNADGSATPQP